LSYLANTQTDRQTKSGKNITTLAEVTIPQNLLSWTIDMIIWGTLIILENVKNKNSKWDCWCI